LLTNAIRYGADRTELILAADGGDLLIEVHDDGPGVPKKYQQIIWERFERGSNQLNAIAPGTGLGLAIVEMIAKAHGGSASYRDSEALGGACFSATLPQRVAAAPGPVATPVNLASQPASVRSL
jgi:signal transduction histidine kinase